MTYPEHYLLAYGGTIMSGEEIWSNSIRFNSAGGWNPGLLIDEQSALDHAETNLRTMFANASSLMAASTEVRWIKFNKINTFGRYESDSVTNVKYLDGTDAIKGVSQSGHMPPSSTLAVTFTTPNQRGRASRGRVYIPQPCLNLDTEAGRQGLMGATSHTNLVAVWKTFLEGLGNWPGVDLTDFVPCVVSGAGEGASAPITGVKIGQVLDTQRRRRSGLDEAYKSATIDGV